MAVKVIPNPAGIAALKFSGAVAAGCLYTADAIKDAAVGRAYPYRTGHFVRGIQTGWEMGSDGVRARCAATDWKAHLVEFGTSDTPTFASIRTACDAAGVELRA
jgi:hypothetical protein